jgi:hypothetical protein
LYAFSLSSSPAYIYLILIEHCPAILLKPLLCYRTPSFAKSSTSRPNSSSYQRGDRRRHTTSHLFCIFRWSSRSPQRHPYSTFRRKRTFSTHSFSLTFATFPFFLFLQFSHPRTPGTGFLILFSSRIVSFAVGTALVSAPPFSSYPSRFTFTLLCPFRQGTDFCHSFLIGFVGKTSKTFFAKPALFSAQMSH